MEEKNLDFDRIIDRRHTDSLKYDFAVKRGKPADVLPLWVADMDFMTSSRVIDALEKRVKHGIYGYTENGEGYFAAVAGWMKRRHDWEVQESWLVRTPGVVFALAMAVKACTKEGDAVLIQQPVYYPFSRVVQNNGRKLVSSDLRLGDDGKYHIDFTDFENQIMKHQVKLFLMCSPHNPVSRVWTREELLKLGEICERHHVTVVSDEIHEDFVFGNRKHTVFASLKKEFAEFTITCTSPAKTFNLAGLQVSNIFIPNEELRRRFCGEITAAGYDQLNALALTACEAAYQYGDVWYEAMMDYLAGNIAYMKEYLERELPEVRMIDPEGTYLVWLDFGGLRLSDDELEKLIVEKAKLWLDAGTMFGPVGAGFERVNIACPRQTLEQALGQLKAAIRG
ncbi:MAG: pyridoxal phosphate-dependent aminotransferase [Clostridiales bacterium]|nr:pyridoxal phosphate-dependent aminotransferase [Clostridiales bacterium]